MEGLVVTEKSALDVFGAKRFDAEYFRPKFEAFLGRIRRQPDVVSLGDILSYCERGSQPNYSDEGLPVINSKHVRMGDVLLGEDNRLARIEASNPVIKSGDILINGTGVGTIGRVAFYPADQEAIPDNHVTILRLKPEVGLDARFVAIQLAGSVGQLQAEQHTRGSSGQVELYPDDIRKFLIFRGTVDFQNHFMDACEEAECLRADATAQLAAAEQTLLQALGLKNWQPPEPLAYTCRASEALSAVRFDAEFFQPKFAALIAKMKENGEVVRLGDCLRFCERGRQPAYAGEGLPVINSRHVRTNNVVLNEDNRFATEEAAQLLLDEEDRFTIKQGDLLINGTGVGTMGRCAPYLREDKALPDNHVTILRMKPDAGLDPIFLSIQLNSIIGQMQVDQYFKGSSGQIELYPGDIKEFRIWLAPQKIQQQISSHLEQAHAARQQAQALLAKAKRAVEVAIEEGEEKALRFLKTP